MTWIAYLFVYALLLEWNAEATTLKSYRGHKGIRLWLKTAEQIQAVRNLENQAQLRVWDAITTKGHTDVIASPSATNTLLRLASQLHIKSSVLVHDLQQSIDNETLVNQQAKERAAERSSDGRASPDTYFATYPEIVTWLRQLQALHPTLAQVFEAGTTYLGKTIYGIKLGTSGSGKKNILIEACIHSREWLACATANWIIKKLLDESSSNPTIQQLLKEYNWYWIPVANVDGYEYTFTTDRYHRKTLSPNEGYEGICVGTDPNRNFDNHWAEEGASTFPCADTYAGKSAFSEIEVRSIGNLMSSLKPKIYFSFHAFSQLWLLPYGWTDELPTTYDEMLRVANIGHTALTAVNGRVFSVGNIADTIYLASGSSVDYAYENENIQYPSCLEVRPEQFSIDGFNPPPSEINPSGREIYAAIIAYILNVK
jgi:hypothetical protein